MHVIVQVLITTMLFVPVVISIEMILLLLLERQWQNGFTGRRYTSSIHYFRAGSKSPMTEKSIYLDDRISAKRESGIYEATCVIDI